MDLYFKPILYNGIIYFFFTGFLSPLLLFSDKFTGQKNFYDKILTLKSVRNTQPYNNIFF